MGWFYGFKLHLIVNHHGEIVAAKVTTGNVHDTQHVSELANGLTDKLYGDKGYLSKALQANLLDKGVTLITTRSIAAYPSNVLFVTRELQTNHQSNRFAL
jgi:IS5 family transposase